ncbi:MAG: S-layer homology domain-containing protein [Leptolyngbya sp. SIO4C5]|nr:S-layer homology domain-containing protein [Leptolyngbya sp. SIO4C5]
MIYGAAEAKFGAIGFNTSCSDFSDVLPGSPFYDYITTLKCDDIIQGYSDETFRPNASVSRGEISKFIVNGSNQYAKSTGSAPLFRFFGQTQASALVPKSLSQDGKWKVFKDVPSGLWFDPPTSYGFKYQSLGDALFTSILSLPVGIDSDELFTIVVGDQTLGKFSAGQAVDFVDLLGEGVSEFKILEIDPLNGKTTDFAAQLAFSSEIGSFQARPIHAEDIPESTPVAGLAALGFLGLLLKRR